MSDYVQEIAPFLRENAPKAAVTDYSGSLVDRQVDSLNNYLPNLQGFHAKAVILPANLDVPQFASFTRELAARWHVKGDRVLMVVNLKGHSVRMVAGKSLESQGVTPSAISDQLLPTYFIPQMKKGELGLAIRDTFRGLQEKVQRTAGEERTEDWAERTVPAVTQPQPVPVTQPEAGVGGWVVIWVIAGVAVVSMVAFSFWSRKKDNSSLKAAFDKQVNALYVAADQIGQGSEYLQTDAQPELARRVANFFNRLSTLQEAVLDVQRMEKSNKLWQVRDGYLNLGRMVAILEPEAAALKTDLDAATGGVNSMPGPSATDLAKEALERARAEKLGAGVEEPADDGVRIKIPERIENEMRYRRPAWTYEPTYYQPVDSGIGGLAAMMMIVNQMETNQRMHQMEQQLQWQNAQSSQSQESGFVDGGSSWSNQNDDGQNWGDSGGSDFVDGGADWSSDSGSDFSGGDSGGGGADW